MEMLVRVVMVVLLLLLLLELLVTRVVALPLALFAQLVLGH